MGWGLVLLLYRSSTWWKRRSFFLTIYIGLRVCLYLSRVDYWFLFRRVSVDLKHLLKHLLGLFLLLNLLKIIPIVILKYFFFVIVLLFGSLLASWLLFFQVSRLFVLFYLFFWLIVDLLIIVHIIFNLILLLCNVTAGKITATGANLIFILSFGLLNDLLVGIFIVVIDVATQFHILGIRIRLSWWFLIRCNLFSD